MKLLAQEANSLSASYEILKFWDAYGVAEFIRFTIAENPSSETLEAYFDINDKSMCQQFAVAQRWTLLHQFIEHLYLEHYVYGFEHHRSDMLDLVVLEYETILKGYEIPSEKFKIVDEMADDYEATILKRVDYLRSLLPIRHIVNKTFQILFGDRRLLLQFNQIVALSVSSMTLKDFPKFYRKME